MAAPAQRIRSRSNRPASQNVTLSASTTVFKLNGADFVTIDGSNNGTSSRNLTLVDNDTGTSSAAVWIASASASDGATNNTIKNCIMSGNAGTTTLAGIIAGSGTTIGNAADAANSTNTIQNNQITKFQNGIFLNGLATTLDSELGSHWKLRRLDRYRPIRWASGEY